MGSYYIVMIIFVLWIIIAFISPSYSRKLRYGVSGNTCNTTISGEALSDGFYSAEKLTAPQITRHLIGKPYYCFYEFHGVSNQRIMIKIRELNLGEYDPVRKRCVDGVLRIWDGLRRSGYHPYLPNKLCGNINKGMNVTKFTTISRAMIEYSIEDARRGMTFDIQYKFLNMNTEGHLYEQQLTHDMKQTKHSASVCDWTINIDECEEECQIISPGYPGLYPPNTECIYRIQSNEPNSLIQINFRGKTVSDSKAKQFNLKPSPGCKDDYLSIQDDRIKGSPVFAKFCDTKTQDIITMGNSIKIKFVTSYDKPPYIYNGFHFSVTSTINEWNPFGFHINNTLCNWKFNSKQGSTSTPDHWLPPGSSCSYTFEVTPMHKIILRFNVYGLSPGCDDRIEIYEGAMLTHSLCDKDIPSESDNRQRDRLTFELRGPVVSVVYSTRAGQYQGHSQKGFFLSFQQIKSEDLPDKTKILQHSDNASRDGSDHYIANSAERSKVDLQIIITAFCTYLVINGHHKRLFHYELL